MSIYSALIGEFLARQCHTVRYVPAHDEIQMPRPTSLASHRRYRLKQRDQRVAPLQLPPVKVTANGPVAAVIRDACCPSSLSQQGFVPSWLPLQRPYGGAADGRTEEVQGVRAAKLGQEGQLGPDSLGRSPGVFGCGRRKRLHRALHCTARDDQASDKQCIGVALSFGEPGRRTVPSPILTVV